jgi:hypothetical protein
VAEIISALAELEALPELDAVEIFEIDCGSGVNVALPVMGSSSMFKDFGVKAL